MPRTKVDLKDPVVAAILAFLVPGLGHFYQRRVFKGLLYFICICGAFFGGMRIGHGQVVYFQWRQSENRTYAYLCQFWAGLPAIPALAQSQLRAREQFEPNFVTHHTSSRFEGLLTDTSGLDRNVLGKVTGTIELDPAKPDKPSARQWRGRLKDAVLITDDGSEPLQGEIFPGSIEAEVAPWSERRLTCRFEGEGSEQRLTGELEGAMPRALWNSFEAPLQDPKPNDFANDSSDLDRAHRELGGFFELGVVYTMIAGLLNILAIYDAYEGPAYEGDEEEDKSDKPPPATEQKAG